MSDLRALVEALSKDVAPVLVQAVTEATEYRQRVEVPEEESDLDAIHSALIANRRLIERLEYLTASLVLVHSRAAKASAQAKGEHDDAYMRAATAPSVGFADYASAKEKDAHAQLATIEQTMAVRKAEAFYRDCDSAREYCRMMLRGAEGAQRDLELRLRIVSLRERF